MLFSIDRADFGCRVLDMIEYCVFLFRFCVLIKINYF